jgi:hypothetical protein
VAFVLVATVAVLTAPSAYGQAVSCPADPGPLDPPSTNDAAIEVRELRREAVQACAALLASLEGVRSDVASQLELASDPELGVQPPPELVQRLDLLWVGVWMVAGLIFGLAVARVFWGEIRQWFHV